MAHNYYNVGFAMAFETTEWFRGEAARTARGLATTPTVEEAEASGSVPSVLVEIVKQRQQQLRDAYHAELDARRRGDVLDRLRESRALGRKSKPPAPKRG
jgi:hypothetical protein